MSTSSYTAPVPGCRGSNLAIVSLSTSCQISINTFPSGKPSSISTSVYLFRFITNTAISFHSRRHRNCQHSLKTPAKPQQTFFRAIPTPLFPHTLYTAMFCPIRHIKTFPPLHHMSVPYLLFLTVFFCFTFFLMFYPVYHKTVQIPSNSEQSHKNEKDYPNRAIILTKGI